MRKFLLLGSFMSMFIFLNAQTLTQSNFSGVIVPKVMGSLTGTRLPVVFRASLTGLAPATYYRYYTNLAARTDFGTTNSGAGNPLWPRTSAAFGYSSGASLASTGNYDSLLTDASGNYTGWFSAVNTGNARFTGGNYVYPSVVLDSAGAKRGVVNSRFVMPDSILVLAYATTTGASNGSFIRGTSSATDKNVVLLYDSVSTYNRPLTITYVENISTTIPSIVPLYASNVQAVSGAWGSIIPNNLPTGVRRIELRSLSTGAITAASVSSNGTWPSLVNTVNPTNGSSTATVLSATDAPLPVTLLSFNAHAQQECTVLNWQTASEINNKGFEIEYSNNGINFYGIGFATGNNNSNKINAYTFSTCIAREGQNFYRLKMEDTDGSVAYSQVVWLTGNTVDINAWPNPFVSEITISGPSSKQPFLLTITDLNGKVVSETHGNSQVTVSTAGLIPGIYFIHVRDNDTIQVKRIVKNP